METTCAFVVLSSFPGGKLVWKSEAKVSLDVAGILQDTYFEIGGEKYSIPLDSAVCASLMRGMWDSKTKEWKTVKSRVQKFSGDIFVVPAAFQRK